ncbi:MAG: nucleotidyl transferase AbiEii/AbiGii toxin family protein [Deltaproteobacteria bacterium]|nr:nucleotidyl transferase AbiEii/AbiGii toxin family protein [Deltaproteobacteria bacterium]
MDSKKPLAFECAKLIEEEGVSCALVGGVAVGVWTEERFTKDLDFALAVKSDQQAEKLIKALLGKGYQIETVLEHKPTDSIAVAILSSPSEDSITHRIDLIFKQTGIEKEVVEGATIFELARNQKFRVASVGHLIALKVLSMDDKTRPHDRLDIKNLIQAADGEDIQVAKEAIALIEKRGFHQSKDLGSVLKTLLQIYQSKKQDFRLRR